jgi:hypothetical protein
MPRPTRARRYLDERLNHLVLMRQECADASANPAPQVQAKNHTRVPPSSAYSGGTYAVMIRTAQAMIPAADAARYHVAMNRDRGSARRISSAREPYASR